MWVVPLQSFFMRCAGSAAAFHTTVDEGVNNAPVTVSVKAGPAAVAEVGLRAPRVGVAAVSVNVADAVTRPLGFVTVIVPEVSDGRIVEFTFFLDTDRLFPLFGLPLRLDS